MAPTKHSQFSASASARLLACPGSFKLANDLDTGVRRSSVYSAEGTLAHAIAEACIFAGKEPADFHGQTRVADGFTFTIDDEFVEAVQVYVDFIRGLRAMGYVVALENVVSPQNHWKGLKPLPIDLFGTSDCIAFRPSDGDLVIGDLKFGKGVAVEVVGNSQLRYYGVGSIDQNLLTQLARSIGFAGPVSVTNVKLVIVQPRAIHPLGPIRSEDVAPDELVRWARNELYQGVEAALADQGTTFAPGKHCRFCPGSQSATCDAIKDFAVETARMAFANAPLDNAAAAQIDGEDITLPAQALTDAELATLLDRIVVCKPFFSAVEQIAQARMEAQSRPIPGWKLVPKQARRKWADDDQEEMIATLERTGLDPDDFTARTILSPAQVEKKLGKKTYEQVVKPHVVKQSSGLTLAPEGDPRGRVAGRTPQEAFATPAAISTPASDDW